MARRKKSYYRKKVGAHFRKKGYFHKRSISGAHKENETRDSSNHETLNNGEPCQYVGEEPVGEEPVDEEPFGEEPVGEEPVGEEPFGEEPSVINDIPCNNLDNEDPVLPKVFCPKCNGDISEMSRTIHEGEIKMVIAKVYNFFEQEYAELKKRYRRMDLAPLSKFSVRTALATGVSESTVLEILQERERRNSDVPQKPTRKRRRQPERIELQRPSQERTLSAPTAEDARERCSAAVVQERTLSVPTAEDARERCSAAVVQERTLSVPTAEDARERCSAAVVTETLVIKEEPPEADYYVPEIYLELPNMKMEPDVSEAYMDLVDSIGINDVTEQASTSSETQGVPRTTTCYTALSTQQHTGAPPASLFPPATHTLQLLQRHAGHLRVSTHMHEDGLS